MKRLWPCLFLLMLGIPALAEEQPESPADTIQRLRAEVAILRSTIRRLNEENKALLAESAALRVQVSLLLKKAASGQAPQEQAAQKAKPIEFSKEENFVIGAVGRFAYRVCIEQVLGPSEMILSMNVQMGERKGSDGSSESGGHRHGALPAYIAQGIKRAPGQDPPVSTPPTRISKRWRFHIQGFSTAGLVDGMERKLDTVFAVQGTRTDELVDGGTETLFVLVPYVPDAAAPDEKSP